jgi:hypothetical protein
VCELRRTTDPVGAGEVVATEINVTGPTDRLSGGGNSAMGAEHDRAYDEAREHPAQNHDSGFRSRWAVNAVGIPPRAADRPRRERGSKSSKDREERTIDLTPLMRLAQEACWSRLVNSPRRVRPADL